MDRKKTIIRSRIKELLAIALIGDGAVALVDPLRHARLWADGPRTWRKAMIPFVEHPAMTRTMAAFELGLGFWLASRQRP